MPLTYKNVRKVKSQLKEVTRIINDLDDAFYIDGEGCEYELGHLSEFYVSSVENCINQHIKSLENLLSSEE